VLGRALTDHVVSIRPTTPNDASLVAAGHDELSRRFLGEGDGESIPMACIVVGGQPVGWIDYDHDRAWLSVDEVNVGYNVFPEHRGHGYASRAVELLVRHLAEDTTWRVATLLIDADNSRSLGVARRSGFELHGVVGSNLYWKRMVVLDHE
jgi:RimJ/RimL family protein N-acetyltransferase